MRARLLRTPPPFRAWMAWPIALAVLLLGALLFGGGGYAFFATLGVSAELVFLAPLLATRGRARDVTLELGPGYVDVRGPTSRLTRIRGRKLRGVTTAFLAAGVGIALQDRDLTSLEVASEADAKAVLDALGVGHHGFGRIEWALSASGKERLLRGSCVVGAVATAVAFVAGPIGAGMLATVAVWAAMLAVAAAFTRSSGDRPSIALEAGGAVTQWPRGVFAYGAIEDVRETLGGIALHAGGRVFPLPVARPRWALAGGLSDEERAHLVAQIRSASLRARGLGPAAPEIAMQVTDLARAGTSARAWLERLDSLGEQAARGGGYRATSFDAGELWAALEDPEAPAELRAAAARVLARLDPAAPERALRVAESARDPGTERRIRIALDVERDVEAVARELEEVEQGELRPRPLPWLLRR